MTTQLSPFLFLFFFRYGSCADNLDVLSAECQDLLICVNDGTTFLERLKKIFPERYLAPQQTGELTIQGLSAGLCNVIAGGAQDVSPTSVVEVGEYTGPYENGVNRFSKVCSGGYVHFSLVSTHSLLECVFP